jgi:hypothetical protein
VRSSNDEEINQVKRKSSENINQEGENQRKEEISSSQRGKCSIQQEILRSKKIENEKFKSFSDQYNWKEAKEKTWNAKEKSA